MGKVRGVETVQVTRAQHVCRGARKAVRKIGYLERRARGIAVQSSPLKSQACILMSCKDSAVIKNDTESEENRRETENHADNISQKGKAKDGSRGEENERPYLNYS